MKKYNTKAMQIETFFEKVCGQYGHESGLVQRKSPLTASKLAQGLILGSLKTATASLNQFCQILDELDVKISESGLHDRVNAKTVDFMERLTSYAIDHWYDQQGISHELLQRFVAIRINDSSQIKLPDQLVDYFCGTSKSSMKVTLCYEFLSGRFEMIDIRDGKSPDQTHPVMRHNMVAGALTIADLGFFNQQTFDKLHQHGAYFLSRLKLQAGVYAAPHSLKQLPLAMFLAEQTDACGECDVYLGSQKRVPVRLIYERLPDAIIAERQGKAKATAKKKGEICAPWVLELLAWTLYVTNIPKTLASAQQVRLLYRLRWQIELIFKLWKSYAKLDVIGIWRIERVWCQFYARLLALLLFQWLAMPYAGQVQAN